MKLHPSTSAHEWARKAVDTLIRQAQEFEFPPLTPKDGWAEWPGSERHMPALEPHQCELRLRNGTTFRPAVPLGWFSWKHTGEPTDIVAIRLIDTESSDDEPETGAEPV